MYFLNVEKYFNEISGDVSTLRSYFNLLEKAVQILRQQQIIQLQVMIL